MIPFLSLLSNPITKLVADKVIGGVKHSMEKKQMVREAEIEAIKQTDFAKIKKEEAIAKADAAVRKVQANGMNNTWRDEAITVVYLSLLVAHFTPWTAPYMEQGWALLQQANEYFWWGLMGVIGGTFGLNLTNKLKK